MIHFVTLASNQADEGFSKFLKPSAENNNINLKVIDYYSKYLFENRNKDYSLKLYLQNIDNEDIVLFTDGYDTFFMSNADEIEEKYYKENIDVLFSCETNCWPDLRLSLRYPKSDSTPFKFLNSGGFIGKVGVIKKILDEDTSACDKSWFRWSNQYLWTLNYFKHPDKIGLDTKCNIFCTFADAAITNRYFNDKKVYCQEMKKWFNLNFDITEGRIFNKITNTMPCVAHFPGFSQNIMDNDIMDMISCQNCCH